MLRSLLVIGAAAVCGSADAATLEFRALQRDGRPLAGAVVTVDGESPALPATAPVDAVMDQVDLTFVPHVLVIPVGSSVRFPNSDLVSHQVYSFSDARQFQLPLYRGKPYPPVTFDRAGVVTLGCNIHDNMLAYIVVTAAPFFGRTGADGAWSVSGVPNGKYRVTVWHALLGKAPAPRTIEIREDTARLEIRLDDPLKPVPLTGRPKSWEY